MSMIRHIPGHRHLQGLWVAACHGPALPAIAVAATLASTALGAVGSIQQGKAANAQAAYQAGVARNNQILAERAAKDAEARGRVSALNKRNETKQLIGRQRTQLAANGVLVDRGSALDIVADTAKIGETDALTLENNADREAANFRAQGANFQADSELALLRGKSAVNSSYFQAGGVALDGVGQVASKWYSFKKAGVAGVP